LQSQQWCAHDDYEKQKFQTKKVATKKTPSLSPSQNHMHWLPDANFQQMFI
jgi:hypothetical protein